MCDVLNTDTCALIYGDKSRLIVEGLGGPKVLLKDHEYFSVEPFLPPLKCTGIKFKTHNFFTLESYRKYEIDRGQLNCRIQGLCD